MYTSKYFRLVRSLILLILSAGVAHAQYLKLPFEEVAQTADLIFIGTVDAQQSRLNEKKSMIFTDVLFKDVVVISATERSTQRSASVVRLTYAGGTVGDVVISVSEAPSFSIGRRYLIFMADDGRTYANPIIGGPQGFFEVIKDSGSSAEFVLSAGRKAIVGLSNTGLRLSEKRVSAVQAGRLVAEQEQTGPTPGIETRAAAPADSESAYHPAARLSDQPEQPLELAQFIKQLTDVTLRKQLERRLIKRDGIGFFYHNNGGKVQAEQIRTSAPPLRLISQGPVEEGRITFRTDVERGVPASSPLESGPSRSFSSPSSPTGGATGACGYHNLRLVMEQVSSAWWEWGINNDSMYVWNQAMDVYRYVDDDGSWGDNSTNEFAGYPSSSDVDDQYGFGWSPGALAMCITTMGIFQPTCGRIAQSDVCWNPAYSWTDDFNLSLDGTPLLLRPIDMHELGHTWGNQRGTYAETYDYDVATVMQPYYDDVVEDGWGIHVNDAYLIRRIYDDQTSILSLKDIGVESYYASNGLNNSWTNAASYTPGQSITLNNVLVENMSYSAVSDLRIRFYLSTNKTISTGDYQLGSYWFWASFCGECSNVGSYTTTIPTDIPPGNYYVGAIVTMNGFGNDDLTWNNSTFFHRRITVTCSGTFSVFPGSRSFASGGGHSSVDVSTVGSACGWTASSTVSWINITSGGSGTGNGTIYYSVAANTGPGTRTGYILIPGGFHTVTQSGGCLVTTTTPISFGTNAFGSLSSGDCLSQLRILTGSLRPYADRYSFAATVGQQVTISLSSSAVDSYVYLLGPGGAVIAQDDDGGPGTDSRIPPGTGFFTLPSTGTYTIEVTSFGVSDTGSYRLTLSVPFNDVLASHPFYNEINKLAAAGVTTGCGGGNYCPDANVTREQMAAFIIRALGQFNPPAPPFQRFLDVPPSNFFYAFIEQMAVRGITTGCPAPNYCPSQSVTREQMAAFIIRALGVFDPPTPPFQRFLDVPPSNFFYEFIEEMAVRGITTGCPAPNYCPSQSVTRGQMAAFLVRAFGL